MNICTIIDENWLDFHAERFIRLALRAMPKRYIDKPMGVDIELNTYYLVIVHRSDKKKLAEHPVVKKFDHVSWVKHDAEKPGYLQYNALRFSLLKRFKLDEVLYMDADVDIWANLKDIPRESDADLLWCKSPCEIAGMADLLQLVGLDGSYTEAMPHHNAGLLYMRKDFAKEYQAAAQKAIDAQYTPRMIGNGAFNIMVRSLKPEQHAQMPYKYGHIWWDNERKNTALTTHYCNDKGKEFRKYLDSKWVDPE